MSLSNLRCKRCKVPLEVCQRESDNCPYGGTDTNREAAMGERDAELDAYYAEAPQVAGLTSIITR